MCRREKSDDTWRHAGHVKSWDSSGRCRISCTAWAATAMTYDDVMDSGNEDSHPVPHGDIVGRPNLSSQRLDTVVQTC